jgi:hypothetical protein
MSSPYDRLGVFFLSAIILAFGSYTLINLNPSAQVAQAVYAPTDELVNYYPFENGSGSDTVGGAHGTVNEATSVTGKIGGALQFDGVNDTVTVPSFTSLDGKSQASISLWIKPEAPDVGIFDKWGVGRLVTFSLIGTTYRVNWRYGGSGTTGSSLDVVGGAGKIGTWQHVVLVFNNGVATIYVDGQSAVSRTGSSSGPLNSGVTDPLTFGKSSGSTAPFKGSLDEVRVYTRALSPQDIADLYAQGGASTGGGSGATTSVNGSCGTTVNQCTTGSFSDVTDTSTNYLWSCAGTGTGITAQCSLPITQTQPPAPSTPGIKTVKQDGTGNYSTVQACANAAQPGDTCLVYAGNYPEAVSTARGGTGESSRIIFKAEGVATIKEFNFKHPYVTLDGFDITGSTATWAASVIVGSAANYCLIINNTIRDGAANVGGIRISEQSGVSADNCIVRGNTLRNLRYVFWSISGDNHLFENNKLERLNSGDFIYLFGRNTTIRRNIFREGNAIAGSSNHPDFIQTFGNNGDESSNMLIEENWIENLDPGVALGQINSGGIDAGLQNNIYNWTFRRNVVVSVGNNMSASLPGVIWENNTFYRLAHAQNGINSGGSLTRGDSSRSIIMNNLFLAGGAGADRSNDTSASGYYSFSSGGVLSKEVIGLYVTGEGTNGGSGGPIAVAIQNDLVTNGYLINTNGGLTNKARSLTDISQFVLSDTYSSYKTKMFDTLRRTVELDVRMRSTIGADYNFVAGSAPYFYAKPSGNCTEGIFTPFKLCEVHGINGGDPGLQNINDPDGPDNTPFTADDGLKPLSGSPLCGKGYNGTDIGAYSCSSGTVLAASSGSLIPASGSGATTPPPPTSCATTNTCKPGDFNKDGTVNTNDYSYLNSSWNTSDPTTDLNKDGRVNTLDYAIMIQNWMK